MKHFLARIAASALQTQPARPRLQPMLGSIYAPDIAFSPVDSSFSTTSLAYDTEPIARTTSSTAFAAQQSKQWTRSVDTPHHEPQGAYTNSEQSQSPSVKRVSQRYLHPEAPLMPVEPFASQTSLDTKSTSNETTQQRSEVTEPSLHSSRAAQPLMPYAPQAIRISPLRPAPVATAAQRTVSNSEPDEIHIHIGRVEVAAITPSAPRPAASPLRKSISLEEYLRHSNGGHT